MFFFVLSTVNFHFSTACIFSFSLAPYNHCVKTSEALYFQILYTLFGMFMNFFLGSVLILFAFSSVTDLYVCLEL